LLGAHRTDSIGKRTITADHLTQLKAEGYLSHSEIEQMDEADLVDEVERFAAYIDRKNEAQRRANP